SIGTSFLRYHIPRYFLKPQGNILVLFEEMGGRPEQITVNTVSVKSHGKAGLFE
ncbi:unnamed protein product, partial [Urochloa humidicola]